MATAEQHYGLAQYRTSTTLLELKKGMTRVLVLDAASGIATLRLPQDISKWQEGGPHFTFVVTNAATYRIKDYQDNTLQTLVNGDVCDLCLIDKTDPNNGWAFHVH